MSSELIAALLTPAGRGAVAIVHLAGSGVTAIIAKHFTSVRNEVANLAIDAIRFGRWRSSSNDNGDVGEELVVRRRGDEEFEIHCHGGAAASTAIVDVLRDDGCRVVSWTEWTAERCIDPIVAEAREALAFATTERTAALLLDQHAGALRTAIHEVLRLVEKDDLRHAEVSLRKLVARYDIGRHCIAPYRVVLAGRPNVGKSSLINVLVGFRRSVVFDHPGTTRDVVTVPVVLEGWPVELADTAGLRESSDPLEEAGIAAAGRRQTDADLVIVVLDLSAPRTEDDERLLAAHPQALIVANKADLATTANDAQASALRTSATLGLGIDALIAAIVERLVIRSPALGEAVPFTQRQADLFHQAITMAAAGDVHATSEVLRCL